MMRTLTPLVALSLAAACVVDLDARDQRDENDAERPRDAAANAAKPDGGAGKSGGTTGADAATGDGPATDGGIGGSQLVVALATGDILTWPLDPHAMMVLQTEPRHVLKLGAPLAAMVPAATPAAYFASTQPADAGTSTVHALAVAADGTVAQTSAQQTGTGATRLRIDQTGQWLSHASAGAFHTLEIKADGTLGETRKLLACDAHALIDIGGGYLATCAGEAKVMRLAASSNGPTDAQPLVVFPQFSYPTSMLPFDGEVWIHGRKRVGIPGSENRVWAVRIATATVEETLELLLPDMPRALPFATAALRHPTLAVGYFINGGSVAYGGNHVAVVARVEGKLQIIQHVILPPSNTASSTAAFVSPDGRWLLIGSNAVSEVRAWPVDAATGKLGQSHVVVLADMPVFIDAR